jgi:hypothetical protein
VQATLSPPLSRKLAALAQRLPFDARASLVEAVNDIKTSDSEPVHTLEDSRVAEKPRAFIRSLWNEYMERGDRL